MTIGNRRGKVFVSYARQDSDFVKFAVTLLKVAGVNVFIDVLDFEYGEKWRAQLNQAILACERMIVFWTLEASRSIWVDREWRMADALGRRIIPLKIDTTPLPQELSEYQGVSDLLDALSLYFKRFQDRVVPSDLVAPATKPNEHQSKANEDSIREAELSQDRRVIVNRLHDKKYRVVTVTCEEVFDEKNVIEWAQREMQNEGPRAFEKLNHILKQI